MPDRPTPNAVTLRDVAHAAGVDVSTVSRVLQAKGRASEETRARILAAADRLGYTANPAARALKTARSRTILMVVPQIENPVFASAIIGAEATARQQGYGLVVSYDDGAGAGEIIRDVSGTNMIEGVVVASFDDDAGLRQTLEATTRPHVVLNRLLPGAAQSIAIDTRAAARMGVAHLVALGHRRIGHLAGRLGGFNGEMRRQGWAEALAEAGIAPEPGWVAEAGYDPARVAAAVDRLLAQRVTAIHAATLLTGATAIARLHALGCRVPEEVSVVTMHDDLLARVVYPEITTVALPTAEMGQQAVSALIAQIEGRAECGEAAQAGVLLPPGELIVRDSACPPAA